MDFSYPWRFEGRRSAAMGTGGMVATSQPLAARAGLRALEDGGTAADAAVTAAAVLNVVEPHMTGIGGDMFALVHRDGDIIGLNGSGGAPAAADPETYSERTNETDESGSPTVPASGGLPITVPGALDGWKRLLGRFGAFDLAEALQPAIRYARDGFPVTELVARQWARSADRLREHEAAAETFLPDGSAPNPGDRFANPAFADTLEALAAEGSGLFYGGRLGEAVVEAAQAAGGSLTLTDLESHAGEWTEPIATSYHGVEVLEHPPNGQGTVALEALNIAETFDLGPDPTDPDRLHRLIEAIKLAFADGYAHITDPDFEDIPLSRMLGEAYARDRAGEIGPEAATYATKAGKGHDTAYLTVVDGDGMAVSFINSLYMSFGSGVATEGFALQNRGHSFSLDPDHANVLAPGKRPFHTIIPAMLRMDGEFRASWGVMGGSMQPQGHLQVIAALVDSRLNPQAALDAPRFRWLDRQRVALETGRLPASTVETLRERGHEVIAEPAFTDRGGHFGGGQFIYREPDGRLIGGSDPRRDGLAIGY
ncbi:MAG: gamma-glutamyltransferase [Halobacteriales archaeon]